MRQLPLYSAIGCVLAAAIHLAGQTDPVIDSARKAATGFAKSLPDYIVKRTTTRFQGSRLRVSASGDTAGKWRELDVVTADMVAENGTETLTNVQLMGKPAKDVQESGSWSAGEFSNILIAVLSPESAADFTRQHSLTFLNRAAYRYDFAIDQQHSSWYLSSGGETYSPAYFGQIWIDWESSRVLRIEMSARDAPADLRLDSITTSIGYAFVKIGDGSYLLPAHSESMECQLGTTVCFKNVTDFTGYRKYSADTNISFDK